MSTVEELRRLKKRKKAGAKAKAKSTGGAGQDYVTSGKGDLNREDYVDIREYEPKKVDGGLKVPSIPILGGEKKGKLTSIKDFRSPIEWAERLYTDNPRDPVTKKTLSEVNHLMWTDKKIYKTSPKVSNKADKSRNKDTEANELKV